MCKYIEIEINMADLGNKNFWVTETQKARMDKEQDKVIEVCWYLVVCSFKGGIKDIFLYFKSNENSLKGFSSTYGCQTQ